MSETIYRQALPSDALVIAEFQIAMALETENLQLDRPTCQRGVAAVFENPAHGCYFVAEREGEVIGSLLITYEWSDWRNGMVWWIQSVYVVPGARGQGVFSGLYGYIRRLTEGDGQVRGLRLYADRRNTSAQAVYARLGMDGDHYQVFEWMKE